MVVIEGGRLLCKRRVRCSCCGRATGSSERMVRSDSRERLAKSWLGEMGGMRIVAGLCELCGQRRDREEQLTS